MARQELKPRVSRLLMEQSTTKLPSHMSTGYISPCLIRPRICSEPCRNRRNSLFHGPTGRARTHTGHQMSQGRENNVARPELEPRVSRLPCKHSTTELSSHMSTGYISPYLIRYVPKSARNHAGTDETVSFRLLLAARARTHCGHHMSQGRKMNVACPEFEP